nr:protein-(glutamine-N5) methyltransferase, release factor-specific [Neisseria sp.]MBP7258829.1 protein-(glutamine-N5) methyltransferase, release factor-specific [Neisseria sp.]
NQGEAARALLVQHGFAEVATLPDLAGLDRITLGRKPA